MVSVRSADQECCSIIRKKSRSSQTALGTAHELHYLTLGRALAGSCVGISKTHPRLYKELGGLLGLSIYLCLQLCFITTKEGKAPSATGRRGPRGKVWGNQVQDSESPFPVESHRTHSISPAMKREMVPAIETH